MVSEQSDRPSVALVGRRLGVELEQLIRYGSNRYRYVVVSMVLASDVRGLVEWQRVPLPRLPSFRLRWLVFYALASLRLRHARADLVHTIGPIPVVANRADVNTVTFCHAAFHDAKAGLAIGGGSFGWRVGERAARQLERWWFSSRVRLLAALSDGAADQLRRHYPGVRVVTTPRGIDRERFKPDRAVRRRVREDQSISDDAVVVVFVDQDYRPLKGLDIAVAGFVKAIQSGAGPDLLWVVGLDDGPGPMKQASLGGQVQFLGYRTDIERIYQAADLFVLPTAYETFCRAAHEAASCGLPIIAPGVSGISELVGKDEAGIIVRRDADSVAHALVRLSGDPDLRVRMGRVARERAAAFDVRAAALRILALHDSLLATQHVPAEL
jgi:glycosyltransferase involved in cell wall biosynthesis